VVSVATASDDEVSAFWDEFGVGTGRGGGTLSDDCGEAAVVVAGDIGTPFFDSAAIAMAFWDGLRSADAPDGMSSTAVCPCSVPVAPPGENKGDNPVEDAAGTLTDSRNCDVSDGSGGSYAVDAAGTALYATVAVAAAGDPDAARGDHSGVDVAADPAAAAAPAGDFFELPGLLPVPSDTAPPGGDRGDPRALNFPDMYMGFFCNAFGDEDARAGMLSCFSSPG